jgi:hypothetical protein
MAETFWQLSPGMTHLFRASKAEPADVSANHALVLLKGSQPIRHASTTCMQAHQLYKPLS